MVWVQLHESATIDGKTYAKGVYLMRLELVENLIGRGKARVLSDSPIENAKTKNQYEKR
jgi:hypothetical protein